MKYISFLLILFVMQKSSFKEIQIQNVRVKTAYAEKESVVIDYFKKVKLPYSNFNIFIRAFKMEQELEVWVKVKNTDQYIHLHTYNFCSSSGVPGPKRREGDLQIPEGCYSINHFNPQSNFYLSLGINYPNDSDKILSDKEHPGSSIYIHGNCITIGCIPITDDKIKELYVLAVEARNNGQQKIPVHIFPAKFDERFDLLKKNTDDKSLVKFWQNLESIYQDFENTKKLNEVSVNSRGEYILSQ